uniref:hypothetical protein n=1 Tax=Castellaniella defragrans TaxID=75697 RepID=UPI00333EE547
MAVMKTIARWDGEAPTLKRLAPLPVGMNLFIINKFAKDVPMRETALDVAPFLVSDFARIVLLAFFPGIGLWLIRALG